MQKILIVDDDNAMRCMVKTRLSDTYEVIDTGDPVQALGLALEHKPSAILLDLMMPDCSGFELCQSIHNLSYTSRIPIFVISGESAAKYRDYICNLGASGYFEKPIDFSRLKSRLAEELQTQRCERRAHVRVRMKVVLRLRGLDVAGRHFEQRTTTENVSARGFLCNLPVGLSPNCTVEVFLCGEQDRFVGRAQAVRSEISDPRWQRYGFRFTECTAEWVLQS